MWYFTWNIHYIKKSTLLLTIATMLLIMVSNWSHGWARKKMENWLVHRSWTWANLNKHRWPELSAATDIARIEQNYFGFERFGQKGEEIFFKPESCPISHFSSFDPKRMATKHFLILNNGNFSPNFACCYFHLELEYRLSWPIDILNN